MPTTISATEAKSSLGRYLSASQKEPITIEKMGRPFAVIISQEEFESLQNAATRNELGGRGAGNALGFASTEDHAFDSDDDQWVKVKDGFDRIAHLTDNWDRAGSPPPSSEAIHYAWKIVTSLYSSSCRRGLTWVSPHVGADEYGSVSLEWWYETRKMTLFIESAGQIRFLKSWGSNIHSEMEDGTIKTVDEFVQLSKWLFYGK
jgi:prevent-host-death family protein